MIRRAAILWTFIASTAIAAGPRVDVVIGVGSKPLERFAAEELSSQLKRLFDAEVKIVDEPTPATPHVIKLGSAPAAFEFSNRMGVRNFLFGDLYPVTPPRFALEGFDVDLQRPTTERSFNLHDASLLGSRMWTLDEKQQLLRQLAKLKFNQIVLAPERAHPAISIRVDGDTAGRSAFRGAKVFESPDPGTRQQLSDAARTLGLTVVEGASADIGVLPRVDAAAWTKAASQLPAVQIGDLDLATYYFSRLAFGESLTPEQACHDLVTPVCGEEVSTRVWKAMHLSQQASSLISKHDPKLDLPSADMLLVHQRNEPLPAWWTEARDHYLNAMNEMYRANTRAREGGRAYTLYHARRFEFAFQYLNCLIAVRKAGIAKAEAKEDARVTELEASVEAIYSALNALAAVARSNTDRAVIALLNEYGYRPLKRELDAR